MKFVWKNNQYKIEFSNIHAMGYGDKEIKEIKDIVYFYYTLTVKEKRKNIGNNRKKYKKVIKVDVDDFYGILQLKEILEKIINLDLTVMKNVRRDTDVEEKNENNCKIPFKYYQYKIDNNDFFYQDYYNITKNTLIEECDDGFCDTQSWFDVFIGGSSEINGGFNMTGVYMLRISEKELRELLKMVENIVEYALSKN